MTRFNLRAVPEIVLMRGRQQLFLSGERMHNNVKFVLRDEDIQVWWGQLVFRFILGVGVCAFPHLMGMEKSKNCRPPPEDNFQNSPYACSQL